MSMGHTEIRVKGKTVSVPSVTIDCRTVIASGKWLKIAAAQDEELIEGETVRDPQAFIERLKDTRLKADIFTFGQRLPETASKYDYHTEWDNLAVIPISTFKDWWDSRVESSVRRAVRKAAKSGVVVKTVEFSDEFVQGIVSINNETPVRQGKPFWHYQKSFEEVKAENSTYPDRNIFLGAYFEDELVGFIRIIVINKEATIIQILSKVKHSDKRPTNALIAKAVEVCEQMGFSYLTYCNYVYNDPDSSLTEFKRRNGFEQVLVPRYYIPLTPKGEIALKLGIHRGLVKIMPQSLVKQLLRARMYWNSRKLAPAERTS